MKFAFGGTALGATIIAYGADFPAGCTPLVRGARASHDPVLA
jgi:hypothetical protein